MTKKIEGDRPTETTATDSGEIIGDPGSAFLGAPGDHEVDPGHLWVYRIDNGVQTLFGEIFVEVLPSGMLREHWFLYVGTPGVHPNNNATTAKYIWPGKNATNVTMQFVYKDAKLKKADGTVVTPANYRTYLAATIATTYIISDPQVQ